VDLRGQPDDCQRRPVRVYGERHQGEGWDPAQPGFTDFTRQGEGINYPLIYNAANFIRALGCPATTA
jgi:hypothetical protein